MALLQCKECGCYCQTQLDDGQATTVCAACGGKKFRKLGPQIRTGACYWCHHALVPGKLCEVALKA
jgi:hypothetical protein